MSTLKRKLSVLGAWLVVTAICLSFGPARANTCPTNPDGSCIPVPATSDAIAVLNSLVPSPSPGTTYTLNTFLTESIEEADFATEFDIKPPVGPSGVYSSAILQLNEPGSSIYSDTVLISSNILEQQFTIIMHSDPVPGFIPTTFLDETGGWQDVSGVLDLSAGTIFVASDLDTTPLPAALPLFATGLSGLALLGWRRKRKAQA
jgi:hypothetical protein